ncbi:Sulfur carrier protein ThiS adenylyltransferase [Flagellimonas maritima]|uniref:Molybdopterin-synthase adenylyltransferase n=1 Tax=Flagellimonas maritima TaxID=1383885 RepID=A0A2Z4LXJ1_9FLAO|nr:HesA/MoeB/ThiF family protein [Allomuricauda aurantiaca]AWX46088.1 Sulfur carrier protein ThiS adenylyltransferase [Allomuricauda aurantiaca]
MESRYSRQTRLKEFGSEGQTKLASGKVLVVGLGGLGIPVLQYLNAMGVGTLGLVDQDIVELHNLQRQVLYTEKDLGRLKLQVAHEKLFSQNSDTNFTLHDTFLTRDNALEIIKNYDVIVDATDNFPTRYLINDACVMLNKPFIYGALHGFEGQISVFNFQNGPTYRCLYPIMPNMEEIPNCNENGVLGVLPGIIGTLQALETAKVLTGVGEVLSGTLMIYNGLIQQTTKIKFKSYPPNKKIKKLKDSYQFPGCEAIQNISAKNFQKLRDSHEKIILLDVRSSKEFNENHIKESINVPLDNLYLDSNLTKNNSKIYILCQSGKRSAIAAEKLQQSYPKLTFFSVLGGIDELMAMSS